MLKATQAYLQTQVNTTTQGDLLIMLYDGAIKFLGQAKQKMKEKDYAQKGILITKAINVISELDESLNGQKGGELAQNLHKLYFYCNTRLLKANLEMNTDLVNEVLRILTALRGAFDQINGSVEQNPDGMPLSSGPKPVPLVADPEPAPENKAQEPEIPPQASQAEESQAPENEVPESKVPEPETPSQTTQAPETEVQEPETPSQENQIRENEVENAAKPRPSAIGAYKKILAYQQTP
ncbi:MAG: flagellar export chaperone FliS [Thermodesulfobacteriota bacterium]|nr:flagellar export chaperone FliS [Thermodesulfobacteriota bacterium]